MQNKGNRAKSWPALLFAQAKKWAGNGNTPNQQEDSVLQEREATAAVSLSSVQGHGLLKQRRVRD